MTNNKSYEGNVVQYANDTGSAISAGDLVVMGKWCGIAMVDIADGATGSVAVEGIYTLTKKTATDVVAIGQMLKDNSGVVVVSAGTDLVGAALIGRAVEASSSAETTVQVKLGVL